MKRRLILYCTPHGNVEWGYSLSAQMYLPFQRFKELSKGVLRTFGETFGRDPAKKGGSQVTPCLNASCRQGLSTDFPTAARLKFVAQTSLRQVGSSSGNFSLNGFSSIRAWVDN